VTEKCAFFCDGASTASRFTEDDDIAALLWAMRSGDRDAAAAFITRYGPRLRRRVRGKLSRAMRRVLDSQDILSTVGRRLDGYVRTGSLAAQSVGELWSLVLTMAEHAVVDRALEVQRQWRATREMPLERTSGHDRTAASPLPLDRAMETVTDEKNRQILSLWLDGSSHGLIAARLGLSHAAVRQRWHRMVSDLRRRFAGSVRLRR
jgi:DNA-directed RNA polymerase specialized sigma24 family protein